MSEQLIRIVPSNDKNKKGASFQPATLSAQVNDVVCWSNTTDETHQPWPSPPNSNVAVPRGSANYLSDPLPPGQSSRPSFVITQPATTSPPQPVTITYYCATHPERTWETGQIYAQPQVYTNTQPQTTPDE